LVRSTGLGAGPGRAQRRPLVAAADVVIVVVDCVDGRLLRGRRTAIDPGVVCDRVGLLVPIGSLILGYQPACPWVSDESWPLMPRYRTFRQTKTPSPSGSRTSSTATPGRSAGILASA
jgi:hypothetical protein